jgi:hypothetical protein
MDHYQFQDVRALSPASLTSNQSLESWSQSDRSSGLSIASSSSTLTHPIKFKILSKDAHISQTALAEIRPKNNINIPTPVPIADFVLKFYRFLEEETYPTVLKWSRKGNSFIICDLSFLTETVLPLVFRHANYQSFVRQINKYGFHKIRSEETEAHYGRHVPEFRHPCFQSGRVDLLPLVQRKESSKAASVHKKDGVTQFKCSEPADTLMMLSISVKDKQPRSSSAENNIPTRNIPTGTEALFHPLPKRQIPAQIPAPKSGSESGTKKYSIAPKPSQPSSTPTLLQSTQLNEPLKSVQQHAIAIKDMDQNTSLAEILRTLKEAELSNKRAIEAMQSENMSLRREIEKLASHITRSKSPTASSIPPAYPYPPSVPSMHHLAYYPPPPSHGYPPQLHYPYPPYFPPPHAHLTEVKRPSDSLPETATTSSTA